MILKFKNFLHKYEKFVPPVAIFGGFVMDTLTLGRIDQPLEPTGGIFWGVNSTFRGDLFLVKHQASTINHQLLRLGQKSSGFLRTLGTPNTVRSNKVLQQVRAVNILRATPIPRVRAKPFTKPEPSQNRAAQAIKVVTLPSKILEKAR